MRHLKKSPPRPHSHSEPIVRPSKDAKHYCWQGAHPRSHVHCKPIQQRRCTGGWGYLVQRVSGRIRSKICWEESSPTAKYREARHYSRSLIHWSRRDRLSDYDTILLVDDLHYSTQAQHNRPAHTFISGNHSSVCRRKELVRRVARKLQHSRSPTR